MGGAQEEELKLLRSHGSSRMFLSHWCAAEVGGLLCKCTLQRATLVSASRSCCLVVLYICSSDFPGKIVRLSRNKRNYDYHGLYSGRFLASLGCSRCGTNAFCRARGFSY